MIKKAMCYVLGCLGGGTAITAIGFAVFDSSARGVCEIAGWTGVALVVIALFLGRKKDSAHPRALLRRGILKKV